MEMTRRQALTDVALAVALVLAAGLIATLLGRTAMQLGAPAAAILVVQGLLVLAGLQWLLRRRGDSWRGIRLIPPASRDLARALLALLAVFAVNAVLAMGVMAVSPAVMEDHHQRLAQVADLLVGDLPLIAVAAAMLFVGFYEEAMARGLLLHRSLALLSGVWGPVLLSAVLFGMGHFYQGWLGILQTTLVGVVFARLTLHWGTLWPVIIAHATLNTGALLLLRGP